MSTEKRIKNRVFLICGSVIVACLVLLVWRGYRFETATPEAQTAMKQTVTVIVMERIAVWAFALAWLVKGETYKLLNRA